MCGIIFTAKVNMMSTDVTDVTNVTDVTVVTDVTDVKVH